MLLVMAQTCEGILGERAARDVVGDERVAVAIDTNPRAKLEKRRRREVFARIKLSEHMIELLQEIRDAIEQRLVEKMQAPGDFLIDRRFLQAQFAGHPQQRDLVTQCVDDARAFTRGPSRLFELDQQPVETAMLFED